MNVTYFFLYTLSHSICSIINFGLASGINIFFDVKEVYTIIRMKCKVFCLYVAFQAMTSYSLVGFCQCFVTTIFSHTYVCGAGSNLENWYTCIALHCTLTHVFWPSRTSERSNFYCVFILDSNYGYKIKLHFHVLVMLRSDTLDTALSKSLLENFETNTDRISKLSVEVQHCRLGDNKYSGNIIATLHSIMWLSVWSRYI
jgi:hypothetical protein